MQGLGYAYVIMPALKRLYGDDPDKMKKALKMHLAYFNTTPAMSHLITGADMALEEEIGIESEEVVMGIKTGLMGPFAGIGDSMLIGTLSPILLSIAMSMCINDGNPVGPIFFCVTWLVSMVALQWFLFHKGYSMGIDAANTFFKNKALTNKITTGLTMMGLIVIGGVASTTVKASVIYKFVSGDMSISIQEQIFDKIMPALLPLAATLVVWYLMDKKKWNANKIILAIVVFAAVMVALGIM